MSQSRGDEMLSALALWQCQGHTVEWIDVCDMGHPVETAHMAADAWLAFALWAESQGLISHETAEDIRVDHSDRATKDTPRTCEALAKDILEYCTYDACGMVSLLGVQARMNTTFDRPSRELIVTAIERLERDGLVWCLFNRDGELMGYQINECAF